MMANQQEGKGGNAQGPRSPSWQILATFPNVKKIYRPQCSRKKKEDVNMRDREETGRVGKDEFEEIRPAGRWHHQNGKLKSNSQGMIIPKMGGKLTQKTQRSQLPIRECGSKSARLPKKLFGPSVPSREAKNFDEESKGGSRHLERRAKKGKGITSEAPVQKDTNRTSPES